MLILILAHTPKWVFALFALLLVLGGRQMFPARASLTRVTLMPIAMIGLSLYGVFASFRGAPLACFVWTGATVLLTALLSRTKPPGTRYDAASRTFHMAGSAVPLALMMGIFFTKYAVGVAIAMHPELQHQIAFTLGIGALNGAFSGIFSGRAMRLWKLAAQLDTVHTIGDPG